MRNRMYVAFGLAVLGLTAFLAMNIAETEASSLKIRAFSGKLDDGQRIEMMYVASTKKLGIIVKDENGNNISGYILKDISNPKGEFDLSTAYRKFGKDTSLGTKFVVGKLKKNSTTAGFGGNQIVLDSVAASSPPFGECHGWCYDVYNWYMCFYCCSISSDC